MSDPAPGRTPVILHADMDAFYASVEQRDHPELRGRPVVVGGRPPRGVVAAASYEARRFGIHSAMPSVEALRRCPDVEFLSGDMKKYGKESARIREVFEEFSPDVEPLSLDEAFIDVTHSLRALGGTPAEIAERLRGRVRAETDLAVSVGVAPVKMVAKIASALAKPDGFRVVGTGEVQAFLAPLPISRLWGVGEVTRGHLERRGIRTIGDLAALPDGRATEGIENLVRLARGQDARHVERDRAARSYGEENTFAADVEDPRVLRNAIAQHADAVARRLRNDGVRGSVVRLKLKSTEPTGRPGRYRIYSRQQQLPTATDDGVTIRDVACDLLAEGDLPRVARLIGVAVSGIRPADGAGGQMEFFEANPRRELNAALDQIAARHGTNAVRRGGTRVRKAAPSMGVKRGE